MTKTTFVVIVMVISFFINISIVNIGHAKIDEKTFLECYEDFKHDTKKINEYHNSSFFGRHKWKIISASAGLAVAATITFFSFGTGTAAGVAAGAATSKCLITAGGAAAAGAGMLTIGAFGSKILDELKNKDIKMDDQLYRLIHNEIKYQKKTIIEKANSKKDALRMMTHIAVRVINEYKTS